MAIIFNRFKNAISAFMGRDPTTVPYYEYGSGSAYRPAPRLSTNTLRSIVTSVYNQIAVDAAAIDIKHVRLEEEKYNETIYDSLNRVLSKEANIDQTGRKLIQYAVLSMLDEGVVALIPTLADVSDIFNEHPNKIYEVRVAKIVEWFPRHIRVEVYNDLTGQPVQLVYKKEICPIIENPFYNIMNEPNSTAKRLMKVLGQLDKTNESNSAGKLDLIIQLPYTIKSEARRKQAEMRRTEIEKQLTGSQYGIAYTDATEHIVQLNRSLENNLWEQAEKLKDDLFNQLGFSQSIFDGTADEKTMLNYYNRTIEPILTTITEEIERKWLTTTATSQGQAIKFFRDPFKLVPVAQIAEIADKFTRNEIMTSNEMRSVMGLRPANDPKADELRNSNLNHPDEKLELQQQNSKSTNNLVKEETE